MLINETTRNEINLDEIGRGSLIWAKHRSWEAGIPGIVQNASAERIVVAYLPSIQNVRNHYMISASELAGGEWTVRYSSDGMETVITFGGEPNEPGEPGV